MNAMYKQEDHTNSTCPGKENTFLPSGAVSSTHVHDMLRSGVRPMTPPLLRGNIERYVGMVHVPVGLAGPVLIHGQHARGDFYVPLATTEGALVASYSRGMKAIRRSGGCTARCLGGHVQRSPVFRLNTLEEAIRFARNVERDIEIFRQLTHEQSRFARLERLRTWVEGNTVTLLLQFITEDAAGQNMVTFCAEHICRYIVRRISPKPIRWYLESNFSGDKKATAFSLVNGRGREVQVEAVLPEFVVRDILKSTPQRMARYWQTSVLSSVRSGAIGTVGHVANALTALFIACGQDAACVAESSIGILRLEATPSGELYAALSLPSLIVGTVGGGTALPTQRECLKIIDCDGAGRADKLAEIAAATALAGELSIAAAMAEGHFAQAHQRLGRKSK